MGLPRTPTTAGAVRTLPHPGRMISSSPHAPLIRRRSEQQVLRAFQSRGTLSRVEAARLSGLSAPTAAKAIEVLLRMGYLEEEDAASSGRGRPARRLRLASASVQVLGLVVDAGYCRIVAAGLDGTLDEERRGEFPTPAAYEALIDAAAAHAERLMARPGVMTLGLAVTVPGLVDHHQERSVLAPNIPLLNGRTPSRDLAARLGIDCILRQEKHALCLAERYYGEARGIDDFAMLDVSTGVGLGVMARGQLLSGHRGLATEIGHITAEVEGRPCGCGNRGCLETVASDSALAWAISQRLGRAVTIEEALQLVRDGRLDPAWELAAAGRYVAVAMAAVINLFNPSTLIVHGRLFAMDPALFPRVLEETARRARPPSFADCRIIQARGSKRQGAVAAMIDYLTSSLAPDSP